MSNAYQLSRQQALSRSMTMYLKMYRAALQKEEAHKRKCSYALMRYHPWTVVRRPCGYSTYVCVRFQYCILCARGTSVRRGTGY